MRVLHEVGNGNIDFYETCDETNSNPHEWDNDSDTCVLCGRNARSSIRAVKKAVAEAVLSWTSVRQRGES